MRASVAALGALAVVACAPVPPQPANESPALPLAATRAQSAGRAPREAFIDRHLALAVKAQLAGDLAAAEDHWQVLTLLEPDNAAYRKALDDSRVAMKRAARDQFQTGAAARRNGDTLQARDAFLRALLMDPTHVDAAKALRELEQQAMSKTQGERSMRARASDEIVTGARARATQSNASDTVDLEQRLELARAGDASAGARELKAWVDANPSDRNGRMRAGNVIAERARDAEAKDQREIALSLYEQAIALAGGAHQPDWTTRMQALKKALGEQYYADGMKLYRTNLDAAIKQFETGAKFDPANANLQMRLREAKLAQQKLQKIGGK
ncbi:MAG TPA: hypothetical protein VNG69_13680 [Casimicrobiaceae bacterium]|nr:hypothetical protein [Casimicrobiaceae bacterium]